MKQEKKTLISGLSMMLATCVIMTCMPLSQAADPSSDRLHGRRSYDVPRGDYYTGRAPWMSEYREPLPPPAPVEPVAAPPPAPAMGTCQYINSGWVHLSKTMPAQVFLGQEFTSELNPRAVACVANVVITDQIPEGASYVSSDPSAEVVGNTLVWRLGDMDPGQTVPIKVRLRADREGELINCATVSADPRLCVKTLVGKPALAIEKSGPEIAQINSDVTYNVVVSNTGSAVAQNVVVTDTVPAGLRHSSGDSSLTFNVGDLAPGQARSIPITLRAVERGRHCNTATAVASNTEPAQVSDDACTTVVQPGLKIVKTGDARQVINKRANYQIQVSNIGDTTLTGVVVTDSAPPPTSIVEAPGANVSGNTATWNLGTLESGAEKTLNVVLTSAKPGNYCNAASVATAEGLRESSQACTEWIGVTGVLVEVVDDPDPILVGDFTTFTIRVTNQGSTMDISDINVKALFPAETDPVSASSGGTVSGKTVTWPAVPSLAPKQSFTYTIRAKGSAAGDSRLSVEVTTLNRQTPIMETESTTVY